MPEHSISAADTNVEGAHRSSYAGRRIALLTQHGKERVVAPVLRRALGCNVELVSGYDTDRLGTFTRDIPREGTQIEAVGPVENGPRRDQPEDRGNYRK